MRFCKKLALILILCLISNSICYAEEKNFWKSFEFSSQNTPQIIPYYDEYIMAADNIYMSSDGYNWQNVLSNTDKSYSNLTALNNGLYISSSDDLTLSSYNGTDWNVVRLHSNISPNEINKMGNYYFWLNKNGELMYSTSLLVWQKLELPISTPIDDIKFFKNICIFRTYINSSFKYWSIDKNLEISEIKGSFSSLDNIYYFSKDNKYININASSNRLYSYISKNLNEWSKKNIKVDNVAISNFKNFSVQYINDIIYLNVDNSSYISTDGLNWQQLENVYLDFELNYTGTYYYGISSENTLYISSDGFNWYRYEFSNFTENISEIYLITNTLYILESKYNISEQIYNHTLYSYNINDIENIKTVLPNSLSLQIGKPEMTLNNKEIIAIDENAEVFPITQGNTTLIPIRAVITILGGTTEWIPSLNNISINCNGKSLIVSLNSNIAYLDGNELILPVSPQVVNDRTLLPVRTIMEALGYDIEWINETQKLIIYY